MLIRYILKNVATMKKLNLYYITEISFVSIVFFTCLLLNTEPKTKTTRYCLAGSILICAIATAMQLIKSATVVNKSGLTIKAKLEDSSCEPVEVKPGESLYGIDGVKVNGRVYKACNSTKIIVKEDGDIVTLSLIGKFINWKKNAGWLDKCPEDDCWRQLFNS